MMGWQARLARLGLALVSTLTLVVSAWGQEVPTPPRPDGADQSRPVAPGALIRPPGPERFARPTSTPSELWDAADYLMRSGQHKLAAPYVDAFLKANPDDATLVAIRDEFGVGSVLRLSDDPATAGYARPVLDRMVEAARRLANEPGRLSGALDLYLRGGAEGEVGLERLRAAGPTAVGVVIQRMVESGVDARQRAVLASALGRLDTSCVPPLIAALDSPDDTVASAAARALGRLRDKRAVLPLTYLAARSETPSGLREAARGAIESILGRAIAPQPTAAAQALAQDAWRYHRHEVAFPAERVVLWKWDTNGPVSVELERADAESELGLERARQSLQLDPSSRSGRLAQLSLSLDRAARQHGVSDVLERDPDGSLAESLASGAVVLGELLRQAIADGRVALAEIAAEALGRVADRDALGRSGAASPLVVALGAPDRRVQLAAAKALVNLEPRRTFPGCSRVVPVLGLFLSSHNARRALVIDGNMVRSATTAGVLNALGFDTETTGDGRRGFLYAAGAPNLELILVDPTALEGGWKLSDVLSNLRADARTAAIPVFVTGGLKQGDLLRPSLDRFARVEFTVTPTDPSHFKEVLERALRRMGVEERTDEQRQKDAGTAAELVARIAAQPNSPFAADLASIEPSLAVALANPASSAGVLAALGEVPGASAQRALADRLLDPSIDAAMRVVAGNQLVRNIQRYGPMLTGAQEQRLLEALGRMTDPALRPTLAAVVGAMRRDGRDGKASAGGSGGNPAADSTGP